MVDGMTSGRWLNPPLPGLAVLATRNTDTGLAEATLPAVCMPWPLLPVPLKTTVGRPLSRLAVVVE